MRPHACSGRMRPFCHSGFSYSLDMQGHWPKHQICTTTPTSYIHFLIFNIVLPLRLNFPKWFLQISRLKSVRISHFSHYLLVTPLIPFSLPCWPQYFAKNADHLVPHYAVLLSISRFPCRRSFLLSCVPECFLFMWVCTQHELCIVYSLFQSFSTETSCQS
jgi:hypothetical protein